MSALCGDFDVSARGVCAVSHLAGCEEALVWCGVPAFIRAFIDETFIKQLSPEMFHRPPVSVLCRPHKVCVCDITASEHIPKPVGYLCAETQRLLTRHARRLLDLQPVFISTCEKKI